VYIAVKLNLRSNDYCAYLRSIVLNYWAVQYSLFGGVVSLENGSGKCLVVLNIYQLICCINPRTTRHTNVFAFSSLYYRPGSILEPNS
jgi:hypothetical protein